MPSAMLWACLHFSTLPLHAVFEASEQNQPCVVIDGPQQRQQIFLANEPAKRIGIRSDQPLAAARAICASVQTRPRDIVAEKRLLQSLAAWAYRFSSHVSIAEPDALLIEIGASLRLFGGWPTLERRFRCELAEVGYKPSLAVAPVAAAARVLAIQGNNFFIDQPQPMLTALGQVPIARSRLGEKATSLLYNVGLRTLDQVFALPRPELARRIGPDQLAHIDRMRGDISEVLLFHQPPDRFEHRIEFDDRIEAWPPLLFPLRRLCAELALFLTARDGGVQRCDLTLEHEDRPSSSIAIELLTPQRESRTLYELIRSRLEHASIPHPVCAMRLIAKDLPGLHPRHKDLFDPQREQGLDWPQLAERLRAHLGDDSMRGLAIAADHRPQRAWRFDNKPQSPRRNSPPIGTDAKKLRPLWLLPREIPLHGPPPQILAGPERIESGWWDGGDMRRDYYVVRIRSGQRAWAFVKPDAKDGWMLHGWFA